jgi:hypothetical protein
MSKARGLASLGNVFDDGALSNRNLIINGAMQVAQRGTSVTGATSAGYSTVDRMNHNSSGATLNMSRQDFTLGQTDVPSQFKHYFRMNATTGANNAGLRYKVEDVQSVPEGSVTLSFYAKGTNPNGGNFEIDLSQSFGSGGSTSVSLPVETFIVTSSWQRFTFTVTVPSLSGKTIGSGNNFQIYLKQPNADNSTNAWTLDITGVQLEVGDTATPFEHRSFGQELALCQRYYQKFGSNSTYDVVAFGGAGVSSAQVQAATPLITPMRATPSLSINDLQVADAVNPAIDCTGAAISSSVHSNKIAFVQYTVSSGVVQYRPYYIRVSNNASGYIAFDAEL